MDYEETLLLLDSVVGTFAVVYPVASDPDRTEISRTLAAPGGMYASGIFKRDLEGEERGARARRALITQTDWFREKVPHVDLGDLPLEEYERQAAHFTFEDMDDLTSLSWGSTEGPGFAGFALRRGDFVEAAWLDVPVRPDWLWIRSKEAAVVVVADFPDAPD
jgi:hypothetical protein